MLISPAYAQAAGGGLGGGGFEALLPLVLIFVVFYFLLIRPQQKKMKQNRDMLAAVRRGDKVVTGGGILGTVTKITDDNELQVEIAEGVRVRIQRQTIAAVLTHPEPANQNMAPTGGGAPGAGPGSSPGVGSFLSKLFGGGKGT